MNCERFFCHNYFHFLCKYWNDSVMSSLFIFLFPFVFQAYFNNFIRHFQLKFLFNCLLIFHKNFQRYSQHLFSERKTSLKISFFLHANTSTSSAKPLPKNHPQHLSIPSNAIFIDNEIFIPNKADWNNDIKIFAMFCNQLLYPLVSPTPEN